MYRATSVALPRAPLDTAAVQPSCLPTGQYSIRREFEGATVFLTGATGFVGSLVLEQLLRLTNVGRIFVLLRGKRSQSAQDRLNALLAGPLFHLVNGNPLMMAKVIAVPGDLALPALGLSASDAATLAASVDFLIHSAADIRLEPPIQETLKANYLGTQRVLELALALPRLRSMIHVSTAYVNINRAPGSNVSEAIYPLTFGEVEADGISIAEELMAMPASEANLRADFYRKHWGFPNTYCLGKHVAEQMVRRTQQATGLPIAIVRPSLVTGLAGAPWPGYCSNWAGPNGSGAAVAMGFFPALSAHAVRPYSPWDCVPGDLVASTIIATAAAVSAGLAADLAAATGSGAWLGPAGNTEPQHKAPPQFVREATAAAAAPVINVGGKSEWLAACARKVDVEATACSTPTGSFIGCGRDCSCSSSSSSADTPRSGASSTPRSAFDFKPWDASEGAQLPQTLFSAPSLRSLLPLPAVARPNSLGQPMLIVHAALSTSYPAVAREAYNTAVDFFRAHGVPRGCLLLRGAQDLPYMPTDWQPPSPAVVKFWKFYTGVKVAIVCFLLRFFGLEKPAQKLAVGYAQWRNNNDFKNDTRLLFAAQTMRALHSRIAPEERRGFLLTFGPRRNDVPSTATDGAAEATEHPAAALGWRQLQLNVIAGILRTLTGTSVPQEPTPIPGKPDEFVAHHYSHLRRKASKKLHYQ